MTGVEARVGETSAAFAPYTVLMYDTVMKLGCVCAVAKIRVK